MLRFSIVVVVLTVAAFASAGEVKIIETPNGIIAEYTGTPEKSSDNGGVPAAAGDSARGARATYLAAQIEQLKKELEALKPTGIETEEEVAANNAALSEKKRQLEAFTDELRQLKEAAKPKVAQKTSPDGEVILNQQNKRQEMKRQVREMKAARAAASAPASAE